MMPSWHWHTFDSMEKKALYEVLQLREAVFVLEQKCFYQDLDGIDFAAQHLLGYNDKNLIAYARIYEKDGSVYVGRFLLDQPVRGKGVANLLMKECLTFIKANYPGERVMLAAQQQLTGFYAKHGFTAVSEPYDDAGILHIDMCLS